VRHRTVCSCIAASAVAILLASACSSSSSTGSSSTGDTSTSAPSAASSGLAAARAIVAQASKVPTQIPVTAPLGGPIPKGKTIDFIGSGTSTSAIYLKVFTQAATVLGWTVHFLNTDGSPASVVSAWQQAVQLKPDAVVASAFPRSLFNPELAQLHSDKIPVFEVFVPDSATNGINLVLAGPSDDTAVGKDEAAWVASDTDGKANVLLVDLPAFPTLASVRDSFTSNLKSFCSSCTVSLLNLATTDLGTTSNARIVAFLQAHPKINYVALDYDAEDVGLPAALQAAGLSSVKFVGFAPGTVNLQYVKQGQEAATVALPYYEMWWTIADAIARTFLGESLAPDAAPTRWIILTNKSSFSATAIAPFVPDLQAKFESLWKVR
jgi:ribose transport system substrate-binding protein